IAPYKAAVFPLVQNNEGIVNLSRALKQEFEDSGISVFYLEKGSIGKRYAKADEIGIPYAITIDHESLEDKMATIRFRDTGKQIRVSLTDLRKNIYEFLKEDRQDI
ncbi:MAG: His/Gly/Thr/Pro-type tRNA ligase C-terminal domain-containing protein, partial [Candidatus Anstonellales archaeon]